MRAPKPQTLGYYNTTLDYYTLNTNQVCHSTVYQEESIIYILICQMHPNCPHKHALPTRAWEISISTSIVGYYRNCIKTNQAHTRCNIDTGRFCNFLAKTHSMYSQNAIYFMALKQLIQTKNNIMIKITHSSEQRRPIRAARIVESIQVISKVNIPIRTARLVESIHVIFKVNITKLSQYMHHFPALFAQSQIQLQTV